MTLQRAEAGCAPSTGPRLIAGIAEIADRYDAFLVDSYGVLHDGLQLYPGSVDCLRMLRAKGKIVAILTNTPRRAATVAKEIAKVGVGSDCYDLIVSAGEMAYAALTSRHETIGLGHGYRYFYVGPERSREILVDLPFAEVAHVADADFLIVAGLMPALESVADYEHILVEARARDLPAVCANPDRIAIRAGRRGLCAGAITTRYDQLGGTVHNFGKPYVGIYDMAFANLGGIDRSRVAGVGDALWTDISGADNAGVDSIFVVGGVHAEQIADAERPSAAALTALFAEVGVTPTISVPRFAWSPTAPK
ncbi:MAG: TIGR01459 family HAD-type hydrolase [Casimicrobiaceae bacterium]